MSYKKKYKSVFGAKGLINAPNYLAEQIIERRMNKKGLKLPDRIWDRKYRKDLQYKYWHGAYFGEVTHACKLLKDFDEDCVIQALDSHECKLILSVTNNTLRRVAREIQKVKEQRERFKERQELTIVATTSTPKPKRRTKSKLGKLK